jgi:hypothetical protein
MRNPKWLVYSLVCTLFVLSLYSCNTLKQIANTITNLQRVKFKLENTQDFRLGGVSLSNKSSITDFSLIDAANLVKSFRNKTLPAEFVLNVAAINPNDGKNGAKPTLATIAGLDWKLYIDDVETIAGSINREFTVPSTGEQTIIPLTVSIDLFKFFKNKSYEQIAELALALGGVKGNSARLKLDAKPTIKTPIGPISYPGRITIVNTKFSS